MYIFSIAVILFWDRIYDWLGAKNVMPGFDYHDVMFGCFMENKDIEFICNNILL